MSYVSLDFPEEPIGHNRFFILTGIPGSGKSYLLSHVETVIPKVPFGEALFANRQKKYPFLKNPDDMRQMLTQVQVREGVLEIVDWLLQNQPVILDTHVVYRQQGAVKTNLDIDR